jgi:hypothetical protein
MKIAALNFLIGRSCASDDSVPPERKLEVSEFHDVVSMAFYGERYKHICEVISYYSENAKALNYFNTTLYNISRGAPKTRSPEEVD